MKAILLALLGGLLVLGISTMVFRVAGAARSAKTMLLVFLAIVPVLTGLVLLTPPDLGFLPDTLVNPLTAVDLGFALFLYTAGFFGGLLQLYNLADRGFSLRILIDALELQLGRTSLDQVMTGYSAGKGIAWMYGKRIDGMTATGLIRLEAGNMELTGKGWRVARGFGWLRDFTRQPSMAPGQDL
jgi:hypothetical protein